jgi:hypothetical protein
MLAFELQLGGMTTAGCAPRQRHARADPTGGLAGRLHEKNRLTRIGACLKMHSIAYD